MKTYYVLRNTLDTKNNHEERTKKKYMVPWTYWKSSKTDGISDEIFDCGISVQ